MITTKTDTELSELQELVKLPGFALFKARTQQEWRDRFPERLKIAIAKAKSAGNDLEVAIQKEDYAQDQINIWLGWPEERIRQLVEAKAQGSITDRFLGRRRA